MEWKMDKVCTHLISHYKLSLSWISLARVFSPVALRVSISMFQLRGLPFPPTHSLRISKLICSASSRNFVAIALTSAPVSSFRSRTPNRQYFVPISLGILISLPFLPGKFSSFNRFGLSSATREATSHAIQCLKQTKYSVQLKLRQLTRSYVTCLQLSSQSYWTIN